MKLKSSKAPFRYTGRYTDPRRAIGRHTLVRALIEEYKFGTSITKLYAGLLAQALVSNEPELLSECDLDRCGLNQGEHTV